MVFPVSGVEVNPLIPLLIGLVVSTFTSMGGVSGAFLLLPFQVSILNFTSPEHRSTNRLLTSGHFRKRLGEAVSCQGSMQPGIHQC